MLKGSKAPLDHFHPSFLTHLRSHLQAEGGSAVSTRQPRDGTEQKWRNGVHLLHHTEKPLSVMGKGAGQILLLSALLQTVRTCVLVSPPQGYYVVAVVKKSDVGITWNSLRGKKSCHTAVGTSAGWIVPLGLIYNQTGSCKFGKCVLKGKWGLPRACT